MAEFITELDIAFERSTSSQGHILLKTKGFIIEYGYVLCRGYTSENITLDGGFSSVVGAVCCFGQDAAEAGYSCSINNLTTRGITLYVGGKDNKNLNFLVIGH